MKDAQHPFFRPLWRRIAVVAVCVVWAGIEWFGGDRTWTYITLGIAAYGAWTFLIRYDPGPSHAPETPAGPGDAPPR